MNSLPALFRRALVCVLLSLSTAVSAQEASGVLNDPLKAAASAAGLVAPDNGLLLPGVTLTQGISEITGVAVSPLLGVSAIGAWTWWRTDAAQRARLPWYCSPWSWGVGLGIIALCLMKDVVGAFVPAVAKKPLDWLELFENKISAVVASTAFVPLVAIAMSQVDRIQRESSAGTATLPFASIIDAGVHTPWISIPLAITVFGIVWLSSHAINVLIAFSPFGLVDTGLKLFKLGLLTLVVGSAALHPVLGAAVALVIIFIATLLAGWSLRLAIYGMLTGRDLILGKRVTASELAGKGARGFLARRTAGVPVRMLGKVETDELGRTRFTWRSWFFGARRSIPLEESSLVVCKGILQPSLAVREEGMRPRTLVTLLPRYRGSEEALASLFGAHEIIDNALVRGVKAAQVWVGEVVSGFSVRIQRGVTIQDGRA